MIKSISFNYFFVQTDKKNGPVIEEYTPRKEVNTAVASDKPVTIPSKNIAGPAVFYPPGKEIVKSEEEGAAWLAQVKSKILSSG